MNFDGTVDLYDALVMRQHVVAAGGSAAAIDAALREAPEPSSVVMTAITLLLLFTARA